MAGYFNGTMTKDLNKGISQIAYNSLNQPRIVDIKNKTTEGRNEYTYSASGQKLRAVQRWNPNYNTAPVIGSDVNVSTLTNSSTTDYVGNIIYENNALKRILVDGGYYENGNYYFYVNDHLGNNRVVADAAASVVQSTQYYPFGSSFADAMGGSVQPYKYNGKELDARNGLNMYDNGARFYDPGVPLTLTPDPLAEKYYSLSPYSWVANNPMKFIDPTGMLYDDYFNQNGEYLGTDNDKVSQKVKIMDNATWEANKAGDGTIDHEVGVANSSLHSESGISEGASLNIYKHYNDTGYKILPNSKEQVMNEKGWFFDEIYQMQFQSSSLMGTLFDTRIRINVAEMARTKRADDINDIKNLFVHENDHGQWLKEKGLKLFESALMDQSKRSSIERRAILVQMAHPTWTKGTQGLKNGIRDYANRMHILIHGLNIPSYKDHIPSSAPLKIKK